MHELRTFTFGKGKHATRGDGMCLMEAVAFLAGEPHTDSPRCADPQITSLAQLMNDRCPDDLRQTLLADLPWRTVGTRSTADIEWQRECMVADWEIHFLCPIIFNRVGRFGDAARFEASETVDSHAALFRVRWMAASHGVIGLVPSATDHDWRVIITAAVGLIDLMIRLTEPQERVIERTAEFGSMVGA